MRHHGEEKADDAEDQEERESVTRAIREHPLQGIPDLDDGAFVCVLVFPRVSSAWAGSRRERATRKQQGGGKHGGCCRERVLGTCGSASVVLSGIPLNNGPSATRLKTFAQAAAINGQHAFLLLDLAFTANASTSGGEQT